MTIDKIEAALEIAAGYIAYAADGRKIPVLKSRAKSDCDIIGEALAALETMKWQPIETAPRDGSPFILGINMNGKPPHSMWIMRNTFTPHGEYKTTAPSACWRPMYAEWPCYPTHWMPLPQPPKSEEKCSKQQNKK